LQEFSIREDALLSMRAASLLSWPSTNSIWERRPSSSLRQQKQPKSSVC
jgi:hypothetical protein